MDSALHENDLTQQAKERSGGLASRSFLAFLATQFLGALNDNIFQRLAIPVGMYYFGKEYSTAAQALGIACFVAPFILLAAPAGYLADRFSRSDVIRYCKVAEIVLMLAGVVAIAIGSVTFMFVVVALIGSQAALFGPSKMGVIPDLVPPSRISAANGLVGLTTVVAIIVGMAIGYILYGISGGDGRDGLWISGSVVLTVAVLGWITSLNVPRLPAADRSRPFPNDFAKQTLSDLRLLLGNKALARVAIGSAFYWSLAALARENVDFFGVSELGLSRTENEMQLTLLLTLLAVGIGVGSMIAGFLSRGHIELGIVPLAATGMSVASVMMFLAPAPHGIPVGGAYIWTCGWLVVLGMSAGMFDIPLQAFIQHRSPPEARGSILSASNFITYSGILLASGLFLALSVPLRPLFQIVGVTLGAMSEPLLTARGIFLLAACFTIVIAAYAFLAIPQATIRLLVWIASLTMYRIRIEGRENLPATGGALLVANHVSWLDGAFLTLATSRKVRLIVKAEYLRGRFLRGLAKLMGAIPIGPGFSPVKAAIRVAREAVAAGEIVCIFPEGQRSRTGELGEFKQGPQAIVRGTGAPVIPVYLHGLWGSIFSVHEGRTIWKWPRPWPHPVTIVFGPPAPAPASTAALKQAVADLRQDRPARPTAQTMILPRAFLRNCRGSLRRPKVADSMGMELTGGKLLLASLVFRRLLNRMTGADEAYLGVLLPPTVAGVLVNAAAPLAGKITVNLNYTMSSELINSCIRQAGVKHVITTRKLIEKLDLKIDSELLYVEDFRAKVTRRDKLIAMLQAFVTPLALLERIVGVNKIKPDDMITVIFTSGSTGEPKGVMLTHQNIGSNVETIGKLVALSKMDVLVGVLPFFHAMGYTTTIWTILALDPKGVYHSNPLEAKQVGELCGKHRGNILIGTPTFLRNYIKRCQPEDFAALEIVLAGAERLPPEINDAFEARFGVRPVEGYGATELSPLVAVNLPETRYAPHDGQVFCREGTVGKPIPGVRVKVLHPESGAELGAGEPGLLWVTGPNVMKGYLNKPELTATVLKDGWYNTGDIAVIDADGFIRITGRESRFSKIAGEMVPHLKIEEELFAILGVGADAVEVVVTAVPDEKRGERLIVLHTALTKSPEAICKELAAAGLPNLWIPSTDSYCEVAEIPVLGTGKLDLKAVRELAMAKFGGK